MTPPVSVVTGAARGIGLEVVSALAALGHHVVMVVRDPRRADDAVKELRDRGARLTTVAGDLGSVRTTRALAKDLAARLPRIDVLVHNAGVWPSRVERDEDGLERAFVVNHLAPFALNLLLEPVLLASPTHVVQVTAGLYGLGRVDLARTPRGDDFHPVRTYATTKLCGLLCMPRFEARWSGRGPRIDAVHPGVIRTGLGDRPGVLGVLLRAVKHAWKTPAAGARPVVRLATDASERGGRYFEVDVEKPLLPVARDEALARAVWERSVALAHLEEATHGA